MTLTTRKRSFPPVVDERTVLLILGSLPGEQSLAAGRYYANPRNQFWALAGSVIGVDLPALEYDARLATLRAHGIGLWDTVAEATRQGSLDGHIRDHRPNDLLTLAERLPALRAIAFNGAKSAVIGQKLFTGQDHPYALVPLPSSSPAHARPLAEKMAAWAVLRPLLATKQP